MDSSTLRRCIALHAALLLAMPGCASDSPVAPRPSPASISTVGFPMELTALPSDLFVRPTVRVVDGEGRGVSDVAVTFEVTAGGGQVNGSTSFVRLSDANGFAAPSTWRLGSVTGVNVLIARVAELSTEFVAEAIDPSSLTWYALQDPASSEQYRIRSYLGFTPFDACTCISQSGLVMERGHLATHNLAMALDMIGNYEIRPGDGEAGSIFISWRWNPGAATWPSIGGRAWVREGELQVPRIEPSWDFPLTWTYALMTEAPER